METHFILYAWQIILNEADTFLLEEWICPLVLKELKEEYRVLIKHAANSIDNVIESMNVPVHAVTAPIAKNYVLYNSQPYEGEVIKAKM